MRSTERNITMMAASITWLLSVIGTSQADGLRGRQLDLVNDLASAPHNCAKELSFDISCQGDCNFTAHEGTCVSKMFLYHGGRCRSAVASERSASDSAADCQDLHQGPPSEDGEEVFVVISDAKDPSKNSSMWTKVGGYFATDYQDYPIGLGLSDQQNITFYSSNETSYDNMLQTMLFYAPCEGTPLEHLDADQSVQLFATAVDPTIRALFHLHIQSQTTQSWQLKSVSVVTASGDEPAQVEQLTGLPAEAVGDVEIPLVVELNRNDTLTVLGSAKLVTASGLECGLSALYTSNPRNPDARNNKNMPPMMWP